MRTLLITMGIFSFFSSCKGPNKAQDQKITSEPIIVDLKEFKIGSTELGLPISQADSFQPLLESSDDYHLPGKGVFIGIKDGLLYSGAIDMDLFDGSFTRSGAAINIGKNTSENEILSIFGEPYWTDRPDEEAIMFYVYQGGAVELRFELFENKLSAITFSRNGDLSDPDRRKEYGVTKPWPPQ